MKRQVSGLSQGQRKQEAAENHPHLHDAEGGLAMAGLVFTDCAVKPDFGLSLCKRMGLLDIAVSTLIWPENQTVWKAKKRQMEILCLVIHCLTSKGVSALQAASAVLRGI